MNQARKHVIVLPGREIPHTDISAKDLRLMMKHLELAIQASQNTLGLVAKNVAGMRDFMETDNPVPVVKNEKNYGFENVCHYLALAAALFMLCAIAAQSFQPTAPPRIQAHAASNRHS